MICGDPVTVVWI